MTSYAIEAEGLRKRFGTTQALDGVSFQVPAGRVLGVLGPNGAGRPPRSASSPPSCAPTRGPPASGASTSCATRPGCAAPSASPASTPPSTRTSRGCRTCSSSARSWTCPAADARHRATELLEWFDLADAASRPAGTYSGGMRRRLDLAASLVGRPAVVFLDEPTTGLDPAKRDAMWDVVRTLVGEGSTVLLTTQYLEEADQLADEITVIDHGRVIAHDTPGGLKRQAGNRTLTVVPLDASDGPVVRSLLAAVSGEEPQPLADGGFSAPVPTSAPWRRRCRRWPTAASP